MIPIGDHIRLWRWTRGVTQAQLAKEASIPRPNLSAIERGARDITLSTLEKIAQALALTPAELLQESPVRKKISADRHAVDRIAKAVATGDETLEGLEDKLAWDTASLIRNRLAAHRVCGYRKSTGETGGRTRLEIYRLYGHETVERLLARVEKHLP